MNPDACRRCGTPIVGRLVMGRKRKYCSQKCRNAFNEGNRDLSPEQIERQFQQAKAQLRSSRLRVQTRRETLANR